MIMSERAAPPRRRLIRLARELAVFAAVVLVLLTARSVLADHYKVPTGSMIPTVAIGDRLFVNKAAYGLRLPFTDTYMFEWEGPAAGDVVVLRSPEDGRTLLKRVVAIPGDRIAVRDGRIRIGGATVAVEGEGDQLREQLGGRWHRLRLTAGGGSDFGPRRIPPRKYLVMGDNRGESHDGREFGLVDREAIWGLSLIHI